MRTSVIVTKIYIAWRHNEIQTKNGINGLPWSL